MVRDEERQCWWRWGGWASAAELRSMDVYNDLTFCNTSSPDYPAFHSRALSLLAATIKDVEANQDLNMHETTSQDEGFLVVPSPPSPPADTPSAFHLPKLKSHDVFEMSVDELQHFYSSGAFTAEEYTQYCLDRIQAANPYLEAIIETNPDALAIARQLDVERSEGERKKEGREGRARSPLHGVPVLVKDNMATGDRQQTTAGSWALLGSKVPKDAHIVSLLRNAGAIILGKSNLDEWAGMRCSTSGYSAGYSARGGQCRNPFNLRKSPEGSSNGSAVSVSANLVPLAFGTETDTSIIGPAMVNGVVGIKPTVGLTSRAGVVPISETQDSIGPYGRTVADAVRALDVIAGPDEEDEYSTVPERRQPKSYHSHLTDRHALQGAKFGLPRERCWDVAPLPQRKIVEEVLTWMSEAGASIISNDLPCAEERLHEDGHWDWERYGDSQPEKSEITVSKVETYYLMTRYLSQLSNTPMKSLEDIVAFNDSNNGSEGGRAGTLPAFPDGQRLFRACVETQGIKDEVYHAAKTHCQSQCREHGIDAALHYIDPLTLKEIDLDGLLFCDIKMAGQCIAAQAGYPIISIPAGVDAEGIPVAITIQHSAWEEAKLVRWASAIEDLIRWKRGGRGRETPRFRNHLDKNVPVEYAWTYPGSAGGAAGRG